jgi:hypothetical protein
LVLQQVVHSLYLFAEVHIVAFHVFELVLPLTVAINVILHFGNNVLQLLILLDLRAATVLQGLLVLLQSLEVGHGLLERVVPPLPVLYLSQPRLQYTVYPIVFYL